MRIRIRLLWLVLLLLLMLRLLLLRLVLLQLWLAYFRTTLAIITLIGSH